MVDFWFYLRNLRWFDAVKTAEARGDTGPLVALLRAEEVQLPQGIRNLLADLLERRVLRPKRGGQPTLLFELSAEQKYSFASDHVDAVMKDRDIFMIAKNIGKGRKKIPIDEQFFNSSRKNISEDQAIKYVATQWEISRGRKMSAKKLKNYRDDKIGFGRKGKAQNQN